MRNKKRWISVLLTTAMAMSLLTGCGSKSVVAEATDEEEAASYLETDYGMPQVDEDEDVNTLALSLLDDGTYRALVYLYTEETYGYAIYSSSDGGKTWEDISDDYSDFVELMQAEEVSEESGTWRTCGDVSFDGAGDLFFVLDEYTYYTEGNTYYNDETLSYYLITAEGVLSEIALEIPGLPKTDHNEYTLSSGDDTASDADAEEDDTVSEAGAEEDDGVTVSTDSDDDDEDYNSINGALLQNADSLYLYDFNGTVYHISISENRVVSSFQPDSWVNEMALCGSDLVILSSDFYVYSTETDELVGTHSDLYTDYNNSGMWKMANTTEEGVLYYVSAKGIYSYDLSSQMSTQLVDTSSLTIGSPQGYFQGLYIMEDGTFLVWHTDYLTDCDETLWHISYSEGSQVVYDTTLTIYALTNDNQYALEAIAALYQKAHPGVQVLVEIGTTGSDAVTTSDALRTLNTEILAGEGPDILIMDGIDVDTYIENELLVDVSEILAPMIEDGEVFGGIAGAYETDDGEIFLVPTGFSVPAIVGYSEDLDQINSLSDFITIAEAFSDKDKSFLSYYTLYQLPIIMSYSTAVSWVQEDGTLDEASIAEYITVVKSLYQTSYDTLSKSSQADADELNEYYAELVDTLTTVSYICDPADDVLNFMLDKQQLSLGNFSWSDSLESIVSVQKVTDGITYKLMPSDAGNLFVPFNCMAINSKTENLEEAEEFFAYMLSEDAQSQIGGYINCYPVNVASFDDMMANPYESIEGYSPDESYSAVGTELDNGKEVWLNYYWPTDDQLAEFKSMIETLDTPIYMNLDVLHTIWQQCYECLLDDSIAVDNAVAQIVNELNLYLAE